LTKHRKYTKADRDAVIGYWLTEKENTDRAIVEALGYPLGWVNSTIRSYCNNNYKTRD